jgi:hypothetical protein
MVKPNIFINMNNNELMERDDWELQLVIRHKSNPIEFPMNVSIAKKTCEEILCDCETGIIIGKNWHGGMTKGEWKNRKEYIKKVLDELENI